MCSKHEGRKKDKKAAIELAKRQEVRRKIEDRELDKLLRGESC